MPTPLVAYLIRRRLAAASLQNLNPAPDRATSSLNGPDPDRATSSPDGPDPDRATSVQD